MSQSSASPEEFEKLAFKSFFSATFGLVLDAPDTWRQAQDPQYFQLIDPVTGAEFTASAYENNGVLLEQWASLRNQVVAQEMPYLKCVRAPYGFKGRHVSGIASDNEGVFPGSDRIRHYLVLCLRTEKFLISFTLTTSVEDFAQHEVFYRWLLQNKLDIYTVAKVPFVSGTQ